MVTDITFEEAKELENAEFIDTRTSKEFEHDHIIVFNEKTIEAVNMPILNNLQRHIVGLTYHKKSKQQAVQLGFSFYNENQSKLKSMVNLIDKQKNVVVYCWRGGMRSKVFAEFIESFGFKTYRLIGGYKAYREWLRNKLYNYSLPCRVIVVYGLTGSGKTKLLNKFNNFVDLEGLAQHRGSVFGSVGLKPNSQKRFESLLYAKLESLKYAKVSCLLFEGESRKIGNLIIPEIIYKAMQEGEKILLISSLKKRIEIIKQEYFSNNYIIAEVKARIHKIGKKIGNKNVIMLEKMIDNADYDGFIEFILKNYYDSLYSNTINKIDFNFIINGNNALSDIKSYINKKNKKSKLLA